MCFSPINAHCMRGCLRRLHLNCDGVSRSYHQLWHSTHMASQVLLPYSIYVLFFYGSLSLPFSPLFSPLCLSVCVTNRNFCILCNILCTHMWSLTLLFYPASFQSYQPDLRASGMPTGQTPSYYMGGQVMGASPPGQMDTSGYLPPFLLGSPAPKSVNGHTYTVSAHLISTLSLSLFFSHLALLELVVLTLLNALLDSLRLYKG